MRILPSKSTGRMPFAILQCASWLVPNRQRAEWTAEWRAELWYVCERCKGQQGCAADDGRANGGQDGH